MNVTKKDWKYIEKSVYASFHSTMMMKHGCVVVEGNKVLATGCNHSRTKFRDDFIGTSCSCHAEMDALRRALRIKLKGLSTKKRKRRGSCFKRGYSFKERFHSSKE